MSFGPRLDRPSAIGDEGRPRATSCWLATVVVVGLVAVGCHLLGEVRTAATLATLAGLSAAGVASLERERLVHPFVGTGLLMTVGWAFVLFVVLPAVVAPSGLALSGFALALFGVAITWADVETGHGASRSVVAVGVGYGAMLLSFVALFVLVTLLGSGWDLLTTLRGRPGSGPAAIGVSLAVCIAATGLLAALRAVPVLELTPHERRADAERALRLARRTTLATVLASIALLLVAIALWIDGTFGRLDRRGSLVASGLEALASPAVLGPILAVGVAGLFLALFATSARRLTRESGPATVRRTGALALGVALGGIVTLLVVVQGVTELETGVIALVLFLAPFAVVIASGVALVGRGLGLLPDRAGGPAVAAAGLLLAAVGARNGQPWFVFACVAGAVVVWDLSTYGLGLTAELGHLPETRRLELYHGVVAVGLALVAFLAASGLELVRRGAFAAVGGTTALAVVALGALVLLIPLRG